MPNALTLTGSLGGDPEERSTRTGSTVTSVSVAIQNSRRDGDRWVDDGPPVWVRCSAFGVTAERLIADARKGTRVTLHGRLEVSAWSDRTTGEERKTLAMRINAYEVHAPRSGPQGAGGAQTRHGDTAGAQWGSQGAGTSVGGSGVDDEPPF